MHSQCRSLSIFASVHRTLPQARQAVLPVRYDTSPVASRVRAAWMTLPFQEVTTG